MRWQGLLQIDKQYLPVTDKSAKNIAVLTGSGLKGPDTAIAKSLVISIQLPNNENAADDYIRGAVKQ